MKIKFSIFFFFLSLLLMNDVLKLFKIEYLYNKERQKYCGTNMKYDSVLEICIENVETI